MNWEHISYFNNGPLSQSQRDGLIEAKSRAQVLVPKKEKELNWRDKIYESLVEAHRAGKGHQFSKQKTKSGMKLKGFHDPRAQQAKGAAAKTRSRKDPEGVTGKGVRRTITARSPSTKYQGKGWLKKRDF